MEERYTYNIGKFLGNFFSYRKSFIICLAELRQTNLRWADGGNVKREVDLQLIVLLGPKTEEELAPVKKKTESKKEKPKPATNNGTNGVESKTKEDEEEGANSIDELLRTRTHLHKVGENYKTDGYVVTPNTMALLKKHVETVGGKVKKVISKKSYF